MGQYRDEAGHVWQDDGKGGYTLVAPAASDGPMTIGQKDPTFQYQGDTAASTLQGKNLGNTGQAIDNHVSAATAQPKINKAGAEASIEGKKDASNAGVIGSEVRAKAIKQYNSAHQLDQTIAELEAKFAAGPGSTHGFAGLGDYFPTPANRQFDKASDSARNIVKNAFDLTGGEVNTGQESTKALGPYMPQSSDYDVVIKDAIDRMKQLRDNARDTAIKTLGGVPDQNGNIIPLSADHPMMATALANPATHGQDNNAPPLFTAGATPPGTPPAGPNGGPPAPNPMGMPPGLSSGPTYSTTLDLKQAKAVQDAFLGHKGVEGMVQAAKDAGYDVSNLSPTDLGKWQKAVADYEKTGAYAPVQPPQSGQRNSFDQSLGGFMMSPLGTGIAAATNAAGFGALKHFAPGQMAGVEALNPNSAMIGDVAGTIAGTGLVAKAGGAAARAAASRIGGQAPAIAQAALAAQGKAGLAKEVLTNTAYGAARGQVENGDALSGAAAGTLGTLGGAAAGKLIGAGFRGMPMTAAADYLGARGVPLTIGQKLGGTAKQIEDAMTSLPMVGNMIARRRGEGFAGFNQAAFQDAGRPISADVGQIGNPGIDALRHRTSGAYDRATAGVNVPLDAQFGAEAQAARQAGYSTMDGGTLAPDHAKLFDTGWQNRVQPVIDQGQLTGDAYQQSMRGLSTAKAGAPRNGYEGDYRDALTQAQSVLRDQMMRGGGQDVVRGIGQADQAYRGMKILDKAVGAAKNGSGSGEVQVFTPAQLNTADYASKAKFGGNRMFGDLADAGQATLPSKVPDSGTATRLGVQALLGAAPVALGGAAGYSGGGGEGAAGGAAGGLGLLGLLAMGGTKAGQKALSKILIDRPESLSRFGTFVGKQSGLFGRAAVPLMLEQGQ